MEWTGEDVFAGDYSQALTLSDYSPTLDHPKSSSFPPTTAIITSPTHTDTSSPINNNPFSPKSISSPTSKKSKRHHHKVDKSHRTATWATSVTVDQSSSTSSYNPPSNSLRRTIPPTPMAHSRSEMPFSSIPKPTVDSIRQLIRTSPIIDNHAHNITQDPGTATTTTTSSSSSSKRLPSLLSITSEAKDPNPLKQHAPNTLAHQRAVNRLSIVLGCDNSWEAVERELLSKRKGGSSSDVFEAWTKRCFKGLETILIDDGIENKDSQQPISWHSQFVRSPCKRIVRIEQEAEFTFSVLLFSIDHDGLPKMDPKNVLEAFDKAFERQIVAALEDSNVVGFKSVVAYRTGLDVRVSGGSSRDQAGLRGQSEDLGKVGKDLQTLLIDYFSKVDKENQAVVAEGRPFSSADYPRPRLESKAINDHIINLLFKKLQAKADSGVGVLKELEQAKKGAADAKRMSVQGGIPPPPSSNEEAVPSPPPAATERKHTSRHSKAFSISRTGSTSQAQAAGNDDGKPHVKPVQFHTGLGDNDLDLILANPSYLQPLIERYPSVPIVLLHSSYPYAREAGYLASVYSNVYLDFGEIFPMLSKDGQINSVREIMELSPWNKVLWSTDGHIFPETYLLAIDQMREVLEEVIVDEWIAGGELETDKAEELILAWLFDNANRLYNLNIDFKLPEEFGMADAISMEAPRRKTARRITVKRSAETGAVVASPWDRVHFDRFMEKHPKTKYIRFQWLDFTSTLRLRLYPVSRIREIISATEEMNKNNVKKDPEEEIYPMRDTIRLISSIWGMIQNDAMTPGHGFGPAGESCLVPYFDTIHSCSPWAENQATVLCSMYDLEASGTSSVIIGPNKLDPLDCLMRVERTGQELGLNLKMGYESEFVLFDESTKSPVNAAHPYAAARAMSKEVMNLMDKIYDSLTEMAEIPVLHFHPESAPGQYEFVTGTYTSPHLACAAIIHTRETIHSLAQQNKFRATFTPKPFAMAAGNGTHLHLSISPEISGSWKRGEMAECFLSGMLSHLPAICAFSLPSPASYDRVSPSFSAWSGSGGGYVSWGVQNREGAIRLVHEGHWEIKVMDALANPCLAVAAIISAGIDGVKNRKKLEVGSCEMDPSQLAPEARKQLGMTKTLPANSEQAWREARMDYGLIEAMDASRLLNCYLAVRQFEKQSVWDGQGEDDRRRWMIQRY